MNTSMKLTNPYLAPEANTAKSTLTPFNRTPQTSPPTQREESEKNELFSAFESVPLKFPVSLLPYLLYTIESQIRTTLRNYELSTSRPTKVNLYLYCEHNYNLHLVEANCSAGEGALTELFEKIERQLFKIDLSNPICSIDIEVMQEAPIKTGFSKWQNRKLNKKTEQQTSEPLNGIAWDSGSFDWLQEAFMELEDEMESPIEDSQMSKYTFISKPPTTNGSNIESGEKANGNALMRGRQRYIAIDNKKRLVCLTYDEIENRHYFNGYLNR